MVTKWMGFRLSENSADVTDVWDARGCCVDLMLLVEAIRSDGIGVENTA